MEQSMADLFASGERQTTVILHTTPASGYGPYATTPSGMVQMAMDLIGRGNSGTPSWDKAETFMRNNFCNAGGATNSVKDYYYGLFSFVKSMLLAVQDGTTNQTPIKMLQSTTSGRRTNRLVRCRSR